jgi:HAE1 family hydrophobic/amphiphilic exporter-1
VRFQESDRESLAELADFDVPTQGGDLVSLSSVTDVRFLPGTQRIRREDKRLSRPITLELEEGKEEETRQRLAALAAGVDLPEGVTFGAGPQAGGMDEDARAMLFAALLSVVFIYLLMAFLFESFILPISILMTIPLAFVGVAWTHLLVGKNLDFLGLIGLILLIGVVVNNGIVLIDYVNRLRREGMARTPAILKAADDRFRPIMMTALTTICGMFPLTVGGASSIGLSYKSFGFTLIGGLLAATLLTLLVVPVAYAVVDDLRQAVGAAIRRALGRRQASDAGEVA